MTVSLCMIVKNEEAVLARCLESARGLFDECIIVDTGSSDRTAEIAKKYATVRSFVWNDDFSAARNYAFSLAGGDYLFWLDADDVLEGGKAEFSAVRALLERERPDILTCPYESGGAVYFRERFLRRAAQFRWAGRVHECIVPRGKIVQSPLRVVHRPMPRPYSTRNLEIYRKWEKEAPMSARDLFYYGRELFYHGRFEEAEEKLNAMLGGAGWYVNKIEACKVLSACILQTRGAEPSLSPLFRAFLYGAPRASVLCEIGARYQALSRYREAVFWYRAAMLCEDHAAEGDFELPACRDLVPLLELVVCHWRLGERAKSYACHKKTEELAPTHPSVVYNKQFFAAHRISDSASS